MNRIFKKRFSMPEVVGLLAFVIISVSIYVYAVTVPHTFTPGTTAKASEVNANFQALADAINTNNTSCIGNDSTDIMVKVGPLCVDKYEASVWTSLTGGTQITGALPCGVNGNNCTGATSIFARSVTDVTPRADITWFQAQQACALSGKRLLTNAEWQMAAAGTPDSTACNVSGTGPVNTGSLTTCVSNWGVNDMVGNVFEWVADWIQGPDGNGVSGAWNPNAAFTSSATYGSDGIFGINEAFPSSDRFPAALIRGGLWDDGTRAGVFALFAVIGPSGSSSDLGFRCAR